MSRYTKQDIFNMVEEEDVEFIRLQFTDMFGTLKNVAITSSQLEKALSNECMFDGSSIEGFVRIEESDMYLYPDLDTFVIFPWRPQQGKVARIICDVYTSDRKPFEGDPRYILKKAVEDATQMGYRFDVGPECEFFLFNQDEDGQPTTISMERAGYLHGLEIPMLGRMGREQAPYAPCRSKRISKYCFAISGWSCSNSDM